jgi:Transposase and inactivated derivatives
MTSAYSLDLRRKIVEAYENKEGPMRQIAQRFRVSYQFVQGLIKRLRTAGTLAPKAHKSGNLPKVTLKHKEFLLQLLTQNNDLVLRELGEQFERKFGTPISISAMSLALRRLGISQKKDFL